MQNINIDRNKVVFVNLTEMDKYEGLEQNLTGGGKYVEENGYGHEIFNFKIDSGKCYGYTPPWSKLNIERISKNISQDVYGKYVDGVTVVFTCSVSGKGRKVCGAYQHARVYAEPINDNRASRKFTMDGNEIFANYNIICDYQNAFLIDKQDRIKEFPKSAPNKNISGFGRHPVWYVDDQNRKIISDDIIDYLEKVLDGYTQNDESKYHLYDESIKKIVSSTQIKRSQAARLECLHLHGYKCKVCGFDFEEKYGELGKEYIEVHHITPIGRLSSNDRYAGTNPQNDLIPLCSNCHSMIHQKRPPLQPDELKKLLK